MEPGMCHIRSVPLQQSQMDRLAQLAEQVGCSAYEAAALLIEEALRMADFPEIAFRASSVGRQAYVQGTSLAVWEVVMVARESGRSAAAAAQNLEWPVARVEAAL